MKLNENSSKIYKFKISDIKINVVIDNYFTINATKNEVDSNWAQNNLHYHAIHELFFVKDNSLTLYTDNSTYEYKNCIVCIPPFLKHRTYGKNINKVFFSVDGLDKSTGDFNIFLKNVVENKVPFELTTSPSVDIYVNEIKTLLNNKNSINNEIISTLFKLIFYYLYIHNYQNSNSEIYKGNESYLIKLDAIINHYQNEINLKTVSNELCLSTKQTSRIIKKHFKKNLSDLVTEKRLEVACNLLKHSQKSISQIVDHINFSSETYFYYQFKKNYGCTPTEYRNQKIAD